MPRHADHDARRAQLADAALEVALAGGLDRVSVPRVAAAAGVSVGLVQHYFPAKAGLVLTAYERLCSRTDARWAALVEVGEEAGRSIRDMVGAALTEVLPLDPARRAEALVRLEFATRSTRDDGLRDLAARHRASLRRRLAGVVVNGLTCGESDPALDPARAALELLALTDGLVLDLLTAALAPEEAPRDPTGDAEVVLRAAVARVFPGRCTRG